jgi:hypothetical protein
VNRTRYEAIKAFRQKTNMLLLHWFRVKVSAWFTHLSISLKSTLMATTTFQGRQASFDPCSTDDKLKRWLPVKRYEHTPKRDCLAEDAHNKLGDITSVLWSALLSQYTDEATGNDSGSIPCRAQTDLSLRHHVQTGFRAHCIGGVHRPGRGSHHSPKLRICGSIPSFHHTPSWCGA